MKVFNIANLLNGRKNQDTNSFLRLLMNVTVVTEHSPKKIQF
jgi:hypothetical protein